MQQVKGHSGDVNACAAHGGYMVTGGHDKALIVHTGQGKLVRKLKQAHEHIIRALTIYTGPGVSMVVSGSWDGTIKCWELLNKGKLVRTLSGHDNRVKCLKTISDHEADTRPLLLSGSDDCTIKVWDLSSGACLRTISSHKHFVMDLAVVTSTCVVSSSSDKTVLVHDIATGEKRGSLEGHGRRDVTSLLYVSAEEGDNDSIPLLCSGNSAGDILVYDAGKIIAPEGEGWGEQGNGLPPLFTLSGHTSKVMGMCLSLSSSQLLLFSVGDDGFLRSWSLQGRCAGAIAADFGEDTIRGGSKKGRERVHLLACASTPTVH
jgi:WD40 repeat protein